MDIEKLRSRLSEIYNRCNEIKGSVKDGQIPAELAAELDELLAESDKIVNDLKQHQRMTEIDALGSFMHQPQTPVIPVPPINHGAGAAPNAAPMSPQVQPLPDEEEHPDAPRLLNASIMNRLNSMSAQPQGVMQGAGGPLRVSMPMHHGSMRVFNRGERDIELAYTIGRFVNAVIHKNQQSIRWCKDRGLGMYMNQHVESINTAGGIWVPQEWADRIIDTRDQYGVFRASSDVQPMGETLNTRRRVGAYAAHHVGERKSTTKSDPNIWANIALVAKKVSAETSISDELQADALANMADSMTAAAGEAMGLREDLDGYLGDGSSVSGGIVGAFIRILEGTKAGAVPATAGHDTFEEIDADDLTRLMAALPESSMRLGGNEWHMSHYAYSQVVGRLSLAAGGNTITDYAAGWTPQFLGYPVRLSAVLPGAGSHAGAAMLAFGNFRRSAIFGDRMGISMKTDVIFDTDEIGIKWQQRYDINVYDPGDDVRAGQYVCLIGSA